MEEKAKTKALHLINELQSGLLIGCKAEHIRIIAINICSAQMDSDNCNTFWEIVINEINNRII